MPSPSVDIGEVRGQLRAKRAMEIAAAGGHHIVLVGPGGCGKTMLARAFPSLLPGALPAQGQRPSRKPVISPFSTASPRSFVAGGHKGEPGELAKADGGLLVLDDVEQFAAPALALVRETLDRGEVRTPSGALVSTQFQLFATLRSCLCGDGYEFSGPCSYERRCQARYQWRALKWFIDVVDIQVMMDTTLPADWAGPSEESSTVVLRRVAEARLRQRCRGQDNAKLAGNALERVCVLDTASAHLLDSALCAQSMTGRDCAAVLRVARTLADLEGADQLRRVHIAEALIYRFLRPRYESVSGKWTS